MHRQGGGRCRNELRVALKQPAEKPLQQIDVIGEHLEQLFAVDSQCRSFPRDDRTQAQRDAGQRFRNANRAAGCGDDRRGPAAAQLNFAAHHVIQRRRIALGEQHAP